MFASNSSDSICNIKGNEVLGIAETTDHILTVNDQIRLMHP